ncbi:DUF7601 domain-containing protein [Eubacterium maltosivorans]|uniref:PA14 domain-containing protein n=1 Tax=Eubacterium maltosivorans TaxID=2041044 RepID=A0A4P9CCS7_EUBML|nr:hypothetical protein [Eubacterium maltosivorans]QCT72685.1 hypothetical protein CPZ25_015560 [Eubacterium maltosivorans]
MKSVKRLSRYTSILLSVLLMLSAMSPGITALAQEKANAAPTVLNYEDDSIKAELKAAEGGALPTGAALQVKALNKDSQDEAEKALYAETEAGLNAKAAGQGTAVNGFIAYSVQLQDKDGKNVTPEKGSFTLKITYKNPDAPEAYQKSQSTEKGVTLYQKTEGKDEQNNTIYTMEPTQEDSAQITADENGKVQSVESKLTTLEPVAVTWESVPEPTVGSEVENTQGSENTVLDESQSIMLAQTASKAVNNQVHFSFKIEKFNQWKDKDQYFSNWVVNIVDTDGTPISVDTINQNSIDLDITNNTPSITVPKIVNCLTVDGYTFKKAEVKDYSDFKNPKNKDGKTREFDNLILWNSDSEAYQYQYVSKSDKFGRDIINRYDNIYTGSAVVTFVYEKTDEQLESVGTVDSASKGVEIQMFDYNKPISLGGSYQRTGRITQGLLKKELETNNSNESIPVMANDKANDNSIMKDAFSTSSNYYQGLANNLFLLENYNKDKTFYYSSFENYAYWKEGKKAENISENDKNTPHNFTVYKQIGTPIDTNNKSSFFYLRGNFMPYNQIDADKPAVLSKNLFDENGRSLVDQSRYNETLYKTQKSNAPGVITKTDDDYYGNDYYFGMVVSASFAQLENGMYNGEPMVYEFNGDDDMWVFIDGVLVLDLGGIHDAQSGSIDFSTGIVKWTDIDKQDKQDKGSSTTIKEQFKNTKKGNDMTKADWNGETFADYTGHEIKVFYMERGAGASNCKMSFNLPVVPKDSVTVAKEVVNINEGSYSDVNFNFKLYVEDENAKEGDDNTITKDNITYKLKTNQPYELQEGSNTISQLKTGTDDGIFTLHHGQRAFFNEISEKGTRYIVQEVDVEQDYYDDFWVNGKAKDEEGYDIAEQTDGSYIVQTKPLTIGTNSIVKMQNNCSSQNHHDLNITKKMSEGQTSDETFKVQVTIGGKLFNGKYKIDTRDANDSWTNVEEKKCTDGVIDIKTGQTIKISNIAADTTFSVREITPDSNRFENPQYTIATESYSDVTINENGVSGNVIYKNNPQITITNTLKSGSLKITKTITEDSKVDYMDGDPIFTFKITGPNNIEGQEPQVFYRTLRLSKDVGKTASITIDNLPIGEYTVEELNTMRYTCTSSNPQTGTVEQNNTEETKDTPPVEFTFTNKLTNEDYFSHTDVVENSFKIGEDGTVTVEQHKVPEGQVPDGTTPVQPSNE